MIRPDMVAASPVYLPLLGAALILCGKTFFRGRVVDLIEYLGVFIGLAVPTGRHSYICLDWSSPEASSKGRSEIGAPSSA